MNSHASEIVKVGAAIIRNKLLLVVREFGDSVFILPGGRPEANETDLEALKRELKEEISDTIQEASDFHYLGTFSDVAATDQSMTVTVKLYLAPIEGPPVPKGEIEEILWFDPNSHDQNILAPSIRNRILPYLFASRLL